MAETTSNGAAVPASKPAPETLAVNSASTPLQLAERSAQYQTDLAAEMRPKGVLGGILVLQLARHAAGMDLGSESLAATVRHAAQNPDAAALYRTSNPIEKQYLAAMGSELVATASRFQSRHERSFYAALRELRELSHATPPAPEVNLFRDEESCIAFVVNWLNEQLWECPKCGSGERYFLKSRARFECCCGKQYSIREGTAFSGSKVPLMVWFQATVQLLGNPELSIKRLSEIVAMERPGTLRKIRTAVLNALQSPQAEKLLVGLPSYVLNLPHVYEKHDSKSHCQEPS